VLAGCLAVLAAGAMFLYWRLDGRAQSWWLAIGCLTVGAPALLATRSLEMQNVVALSSIAAALVYFLGAWRSQEVDSILTVRLAAIASMTGFFLTVLGAWALHAHPGFERAAAITLAVCIAALTLAWDRREPHHAWFRVPLFGFALCCIAIASPLSPAARAAQVSCVLVLMNAMTAVVTMGRLQAVAGRHRMSALDAQRERDLVASLRQELEARFAETLHEVRSIVLALEGGIRVFGPGSAAGTPVASSITDSLVAELERLRMLADPDHASAPAEFSLFEALQHLSALSQASAWPVTWNLDRRLMVRGRPADVAQVVHSLLTNAQKHAPGSAVQVSGHEAGQFVLVIVDDNGAGVKPANRERIFERGERPEHEDTEGHGLGLHIARRLARGLGGELWVEQRPGGGARFVLALRNALPAASDEPAHGAAV
jgi:signal transduction histidine kinase